MENPTRGSLAGTARQQADRQAAGSLGQQPEAKRELRHSLSGAGGVASLSMHPLADPA